MLPICLSNCKAIRQFKVPISWTLRDLTKRRLFGYWDGAQEISKVHGSNLVAVRVSVLTSFKWKHFLDYWPFVRGIILSSPNSNDLTYLLVNWPMLQFLSNTASDWLESVIPANQKLCWKDFTIGFYNHPSPLAYNLHSQPEIQRWGLIGVTCNIQQLSEVRSPPTIQMSRVRASQGVIFPTCYLRTIACIITMTP